MGSLLEQLRSALYAPQPTEHEAARVCEVLARGLAPAPADLPALDYAEHHLRGWPEALRAGPLRLVKGLRPLAARAPESFEVARREALLRGDRDEAALCAWVALRRGAWRVEAAGLDDIGRERETHEDTTLVDVERGLFAVVDGMGVYGGGVWASRMVCDDLQAHVERDAIFPSDPDAPARALEARIRGANARVREKAREHLAWTNSGATVVIAWVRGGWLWLAHVGDCRAYVRRGGVLMALTRDHNLANAFLEQGLSPPWAVEQDHFQHIVTRAIGVGDHAEVDVARHALYPGDEVLLCSDGVHRDLDADALEGALRASNGDTRRACELLREAVLSGAAPDNMAVVVARVVRV